MSLTLISDTVQVGAELLTCCESRTALLGLRHSRRQRENSAATDGSDVMARARAILRHGHTAGLCIGTLAAAGEAQVKDTCRRFSRHIVWPGRTHRRTFTAKHRYVLCARGLSISSRSTRRPSSRARADPCGISQSIISSVLSIVLLLEVVARCVRKVTTLPRHLPERLAPERQAARYFRHQATRNFATDVFCSNNIERHAN
jgi:hypothetical protein